MPSDLPRLLVKIEKRAAKPGTMVYRTIGCVAHAPDGIHLDSLVKAVEQFGSKDPRGYVGSLMSSGGNHFGRVFMVDEHGAVRIHPDVAHAVARHDWR